MHVQRHFSGLKCNKIGSLAKLCNSIVDQANANETYNKNNNIFHSNASFSYFSEHRINVMIYRHRRLKMPFSSSYDRVFPFFFLCEFLYVACCSVDCKNHCNAKFMVWTLSASLPPIFNFNRKMYMCTAMTHSAIYRSTCVCQQTAITVSSTVCFSQSKFKFIYICHI